MAADATGVTEVSGRGSVSGEPGFPPWLKAPLARLVAMVRSGQLPPGLLLVGPEGVGKRLLIERFLQRVVCTRADGHTEPCGACNGCRNAKAQSHPEILQVAPEEPGKEIVVDAIRAVVDFLALSGSGLARLVSIAPAEALNVNAANALLKTLEEPPKGTMLLLSAAQPARLPPTIRSRCQQQRIPVPSGEEIVAWLEGLTPGDLTVAEAVAASLGRPMVARDLLLDPVAVASWHRDRDALNTLLSSRSIFPVIEHFVDCEPATLVPRLQCLLKAAQRWLLTGKHDEFGSLFNARALESFADARGGHCLAQLLERSARWNREIPAPLNPSLRWEGIALELHANASGRAVLAAAMRIDNNAG